MFLRTSMKRVWAWLMVSLLATLVIGCCSGAKAPQRPTMAEKLQSKTVALVAEYDDHLRPQCTGVWIDKDKILTAEHCIEPDVPEEFEDLLKALDLKGTKVLYLVQNDVGDLETKIPPNKQRTSTVLAYDRKVDLAVLEVDRNTAPQEHGIARISMSGIHVGDEINVVGHPVGLWWTYVPGRIAGDRNMHGANHEMMHVLQISSPVWFGNSGGGAFDWHGDLVGIASFISRRGPLLSFFVHRDVILEFLVSNGVGHR